MGQRSNPRPPSPHHRSFAMIVSRDQADGEALAEVVNWGHGTLGQIEGVESNFAASRTDRRYRTGTSKQADADLYRDEAIDTTLLLVTANHLVIALSRCSTSRPGVPKFPTDLRNRDRTFARHIRALGSLLRRTAARPFPSGKYKRFFRSCLALTPGCFIGTTRRD
jgi:hypothetical protein